MGLLSVTQAMGFGDVWAPFRGWPSAAGLWETVCMSEKRTKSDKAQRESDQLEKKASHRPPQNQGRRAREDFRQSAVRIVEEAEGTVGR